MKIAITGANSSVGLNLLEHIAARGDIDVIAGIRSASARDKLPSSPRIASRLITYDNVAALAKEFAGVNSVVHLAGILIESRNSNYQTANVEATGTVIAAAKEANVEHLVFISVVGASLQSSNPYFRSKAEAEKLVAESGLSATIIRTPLLLGEGTAGFAAVKAAAMREKIALLDGGRYVMRPLDVDDLSRAILQSFAASKAGVATHELVGPETIFYHELIQRAASKLGTKVVIGKTPVFLAKAFSAISSKIKGGGISPAVIDVITRDEVVELNGDEALGITLTSLDATLEKLLINRL